MIVKRGKGDYPRMYRPCRMSELYGPGKINVFIGNGLNKGSLAMLCYFMGFQVLGKRLAPVS